MPMPPGARQAAPARVLQREVSFPFENERGLSEAISASVALNRPVRSSGATMDCNASSFTLGSDRVLISVVWMLAWPSHSDTLRRSLVACKTVNAQVWRNTCGEMRFCASDGQSTAACLACLLRMYSKPERVMA